MIIRSSRNGASKQANSCACTGNASETQLNLLTLDIQVDYSAAADASSIMFVNNKTLVNKNSQQIL